MAARMAVRGMSGRIASTWVVPQDFSLVPIGGQGCLFFYAGGQSNAFDQTMVLRHLITARQAHFIRTRQPFDQNRRRSYEKAVFSHRCPVGAVPDPHNI